MNYIVVALKAEAQAFVEKYKLTKTKLAGYPLYSNKTIMLIQSGVGVTQATLATQTLLNHYDITPEDTFFNIGVCGASKEYKIAQLVKIGGISYGGINYIFDNSLPLLTCKDTPATTDKNSLVDMESYGFYDAVIHNPAIENFHIFKVVSDHFQPHTLTKDMVKSLILKNIEKMEIV